MDAATAERLAAAHPEAIVSRPAGLGGAAGGAGTGPGAAAPGSALSAGDTSIARAVRLVMEHPDWRLSLQTHKYPRHPLSGAIILLGGLALPGAAPGVWVTGVPSPFHLPARLTRY